MNKKIKRQSVKKSKQKPKPKPKPKPKKISKKKVGKGDRINLEEDFKELLQFKQQGIELNTLVDLTFKDGRKVGIWIARHKQELNKDQLDALGLIKVQSKPIDKYMKLKEKYLKVLSNKAISSSEKALFTNNLKKIEKLIEKETRKKIKGTGAKKSIKRYSGNGEKTTWISNPLNESVKQPPRSRNGEKTSWMMNPLYESVKQPRQYEEDYATYTIEEPIITQGIIHRKIAKQPQKVQNVEVATAMYINPEIDERKVVKGFFSKKTPSKVYYL